MYTNTTLIEQKTGNTLTNAQRVYLDTLIIPAVTDWITNYLGIKFDDKNQLVSVYRNGGNSALIAFGFKDITEVAEVDAEDNESPLSTGDYYYDEYYISTYSGSFRRGVRNFKITGHAASVPPSVRLAATIMAEKLLSAKTAAGAVTTEKIGDYSATYAVEPGTAANDEVMGLLATYKPFRLA